MGVRDKALLLGSNLLFLAMAYYMVKTASRSIILEDSGSAILPYVWIGSALLMLLFVPIYQWLVVRVSRYVLLFGTLAVTIVALFAFYFSLGSTTVQKAALFYGFADVIGVVLIEQFWSLTNSEFRSGDAKRWYGLISSGGLVGGLLAGFLGARLIDVFGLRTQQLLLVSVVMMIFTLLMTAAMVRSSVFSAASRVRLDSSTSQADRLVRENNYLFLVAVILLMAQLAGPFLEYQFMSMVDDRFVDQDERTVYLSQIFSWINGVALIVNVGLTSLIHRRFGAIGGLAVRPLAILAGSALFFVFSAIHIAALVRVLDKALAYSINRASREMLYVPMSSQTVYTAKAWIDMLGFRLFKVFGSGVIILLTTKLPDPLSLPELSVVVIAICFSWTFAIATLRDRYHQILGNEGAAVLPPRTAEGGVESLSQGADHLPAAADPAAA